MIRQLLLITISLNFTLLHASPRKIIARAIAHVANTTDQAWSNIVTKALTEVQPGRAMQYVNQLSICNHSVPPCSTSGHCICRHLKNNLSPDDIKSAHLFLSSLTRQ